MRTIAALALILAACGTDPQGDDSSGPDAVAHQPVTMDVTCQAFTREARSAGVLRERITANYALVDSVGPDDVFAVELCGRALIPSDPLPCPAGTTCMGSFTLPGAQCERTFRSGLFFDGKLRIPCGRLWETFDDRGVLVSRSGESFARVRVITY